MTGERWRVLDGVLLTGFAASGTQCVIARAVCKPGVRTLYETITKDSDLYDLDLRPICPHHLSLVTKWFPLIHITSFGTLVWKYRRRGMSHNSQAIIRHLVGEFEWERAIREAEERAQRYTKDSWVTP